MDRRSKSLNKLIKSKGFTLTELMIVIIVLSILMAIAVPSYMEYVKRSDRAKAKANAMHIVSELHKCYTEEREYTARCPTYSMFISTPPTTFYNTKYYDFTLEVPPTAVNMIFSVIATHNTNPTGDRCGTLQVDQNSRVTMSGGDSTLLDYCWGE